MEECGDGIHPPEKKEYGKWLIAKRRMTVVDQGMGRGTDTYGRVTRGMSHSHGCGGWGYVCVPCKRTFGDAGFGDDDTNDMAQSPP